MKSKIKSSKFLITGGCGFIGSHLLEQLIHLEAKEIRILDNLNYGSEKNITKFKQYNNVKLYKLDLANASPPELDECLSDIDVLYHLAAEKHNQSVDSPKRVITVNINGMYNLLDSAVRAGIKKVVFTSSLYAYGSCSLPPMTEIQAPKPWTVYGMSKLAGENLLDYFSKKYGLPFTILRLFFTYGTKQFAGTGYKSVIISNFEKIIKGESPVIYGDGKQSLDYVYIDDVINALILSLSCDYNNEVFNIGSGKAVSINELNWIPVFGQKSWLILLKSCISKLPQNFLLYKFLQGFYL
ncbi:MAG: NAD-dependent epimerase/dehydratase family protein [Candidatus Gastranaerophilales bacterium]|nr:NAD-dependent epimerase/dehydratase family protein [Candidatus Gastranaerophilales bacterium]